MGLPTSDVLTINSGTSTLRGNKDASISMEIKNNVSGNATTSMTLFDIGNYEIELDIQEDASEINELFYNVAEFTFTFGESLANGNNFGVYLSNLASSDLIKIEFTYDGDTDLFLCQASDFEYDVRARKYTCKCFTPFKYGEQVTALSFGTSEFQCFYTGVGNIDIITFRDLVNSYLDTFGVSSKQVITSFTESKTTLENAITAGTDPIDILCYTTSTVSPSATNEADIVGDRTDLPQGEFSLVTQGNTTQFEQVRGRILETGIAENAMIGSFLGEAFYVRRDTNASATWVDLDKTDLEEFGIEFVTSPIKDILIILGTGSNQISTSVLLDERNPQSINIVVPDFGNVLEIEDSFVGGEPYTINTAYGGYNETAIDKDLTTDASLSYRKTFITQNRLKYSGTVFGAGTIKPYSTLRIDSGVSGLIPSPRINLRITSLSVDFKQDKTFFEAYEV